MTEIKHTPGPWSACRDGDCSCHTINSDDFPIAVTVGHDNSEDAPYVSEEQRKANAKLIAAAPELLEALEEVSPLIDGLINRTPSGKSRNELTDLNIKIKSAIKKATQ